MLSIEEQNVVTIMPQGKVPKRRKEKRIPYRKRRTKEEMRKLAQKNEKQEKKEIDLQQPELKKKCISGRDENENTQHTK